MKREEQEKDEENHLVPVAWLMCGHAEGNRFAGRAKEP